MDSSQDKNLPASERRLQDARRDGQVARSKDLANLAVLGTGSAALLLLTPLLWQHLKLALGAQLAFDARTIAQPGQMLTRLQDMMAIGLIAALGFAMMVALAALVSTVAAGGWTNSFKPITPDLGRINPLKGVKNLVSKQQVVNVAKLILLSAILGWVAWTYLVGSLQEVPTLVLQPSTMAIQRLCDWLASGVMLMLLVALAAAVIDVPLQAFLHKNKLKMSHEEVKQEHKQAEGNPHVKGHMRARQREIAMRASVANVPKADFVVMNPTHFAVALQYDEKTMAAPRVVSKGADLLAMRIRDLARTHQVPVLQSPMLARALYAHAELDQSVPSTLYTAVAQVLAYVYRLKAALRGEGPMPAEQPDPFVPPELDPLNPLFTRKAAA